jgi:hypothetical protein
MPIPDPVNSSDRQIGPLWLQRRHDLPEVVVGFDVLERLADVGEFIDLVDRQLQLARCDRRPDVFLHLVENLAEFLDRAGAELRRTSRRCASRNDVA